MSKPEDRAALFRQRLGKALDQAGISQSALARAAGVDRSTISALLGPGTRLPGAGLVADCAQRLGVTSDWLLGLADSPLGPEAALAAALTLQEAPRALFDETIFGWHREAAGFKIRHVPATLPDMLKIPQVVEWEYRGPLGADAPAAIAAFQDQLGWLQAARSDYEIALPLHELAAFATAQGYWQGLSREARAAQLARLCDLAQSHYPALRLYLFDAHQVFSAPVTVFGAHRAVVYLGRDYLSFQSAPTIARISRHFDWLVREATVSAREVAGHLRELQNLV